MNSSDSVWIIFCFFPEIKANRDRELFIWLLFIYSIKELKRKKTQQHIKIEIPWFVHIGGFAQCNVPRTWLLVWAVVFLPILLPSNTIILSYAISMFSNTWCRQFFSERRRRQNSRSQWCSLPPYSFGTVFHQNQLHPLPGHQDHLPPPTQPTLTTPTPNPLFTWASSPYARDWICVWVYFGKLQRLCQIRRNVNTNNKVCTANKRS